MKVRFYQSQLVEVIFHNNIVPFFNDVTAIFFPFENTPASPADASDAIKKLSLCATVQSSLTAFPTNGMAEEYTKCLMPFLYKLLDGVRNKISLQVKMIILLYSSIAFLLMNN